MTYQFENSEPQKPIDLYRLAVERAEAAHDGGTFGVGGVLADKDGRVVKSFQNRVIEDGIVSNPTAHVERQILTWYYEMENDGAQLPPLEDLVIVSSLDPCMMCAGTILTSAARLKVMALKTVYDFSVRTIAADGFAGISCNAAHDDGSIDVDKVDFERLPKGLRGLAEDHFVYELVEEADMEAFRDLQRRSGETFGSSLENVRDIINRSGGKGYEDLSNLVYTDFDHTDGKLDALIDRYDVLPEGVCFGSPDKVDEVLAPVLVHEAKKAVENGVTKKFNAAALVDSAGNLLMVRAGNEDEVPHNTALANLLQDYAAFRADVMRGDDANGTENIKFFEHPKFCKLVMLQGPGEETTDVMDIGLYGSSIEGPLANNMPYHLEWIVNGVTSDGQEFSQDDVANMISHFPPFYTDLVGIKGRQQENYSLFEDTISLARDYDDTLFDGASFDPAP